MAEFKNDDLLLVNRADESYKVPGEALYATYLDKPEIGNLSLVESNPGVNPRFTDQSFVATTTMTEEGKPLSEKTYDAYVEGTILDDISTSVITDTNKLVWEASGVVVEVAGNFGQAGTPADLFDGSVNNFGASQWYVNLPSIPFDNALGGVMVQGGTGVGSGFSDMFFRVSGTNVPSGWWCLGAEGPGLSSWDNINTGNFPWALNSGSNVFKITGATGTGVITKIEFMYSTQSSEASDGSVSGTPVLSTANRVLQAAIFVNQKILLDGVELTLTDDTNLDQFVVGKEVIQNSSGTPVTSAITAITPPPTATATNEDTGSTIPTIRGVAMNGSNWVCVGDDPYTYSSDAQADYSTDAGVSWNSVVIFQGGTLSYISYGNGEFIAGGNLYQNLWRSSNGSSSTKAYNDSTTSSNIRSIWYDATTNVWMATGQSGSANFNTTLTSTDGGNTWVKTDQGSPLNASLQGISTSGNGRWFGANNGRAGVFYTDDLGKTWQSLTQSPSIGSSTVSNISADPDGNAYFCTNNLLYKVSAGTTTAVGISGSGTPGSNGTTYAHGSGIVTVYYYGTIKITYDDGLTWTNSSASNGNGGDGPNKFLQNGQIATDIGSTQKGFWYLPNYLELTTLSLTNNTNLANFRVGDAVTETGGDGTGTVSAIGTTSLILSPTAGTWDNGSTVTGPTLTAQGNLARVYEADNKIVVTNSTGRFLETKPEQTLNRLDKTAVQENVPVDGTKKYLAFTGTGQVTGLLDTPQSPPYVTTDEDPVLTLTFPSTFPSGFTPDEELGEGTTLTVEVTAENSVGTDGPVSDTVQPSLDIIQFIEPLESSDVIDGAWNSAAGLADFWVGSAYGGGTYVAVAGGSGSSQVMYSTDEGLTWTLTSTPSGLTLWTDVTYGNGKFVAVGNSPAVAMYSTDGINWSQSNSTPNFSWQSVTYGDGKFVAVSSGTGASAAAMYSTDGNNWTQSNTVPYQTWSGVTYGNGKFVAVSGTANVANKAMYSTDGISWTAGTTLNDNETQWKDVTYGNGTFVAVTGTAAAANKVMYSTDGINWTGAPSASTLRCLSIDYGDGNFVAVGQDGALMYSANGINWTGATPTAANDWRTVTYGTDRFVALASNGTNRVMWSATGTGINSTTLNFAAGTDMTDLAPSDVVTQLPDAQGTVGSITGTKVQLSTSKNIWRNGADVTGPDKTPILSLTTEELKAQKLKFLTYNNRKDVVCGEEAGAARAALLATLIAAGYTEADINQTYSNLDN